MRRPGFWVAVKLTITALLIGWLASRIDYPAFSAAVARATNFGLVLALVLVAAAVAVGWVRWWVLLGALRPRTPLMTVLASYSVGQFANNFLPSGVGGDAVRCAHMASRGFQLSPSISSSMVDRVTGIIGLLLLSCIGLFVAPPPFIEDTVRWVVLGVLLAILVLTAGLLTPRVEEFIARRRPTGRLTQLLKDVAEHGLAYKDSERRVVLAVALTLLGHLLQIVCYWDLGVAVGIELPFTTYLVIGPAVMLATHLPISLGGLGLREGTLVALLAAAGADLQLAIAVSLLFLIAWLIVTLPLGIAMIRWGDRAATLSRSTGSSGRPVGEPPS